MLSFTDYKTSSMKSNEQLINNVIGQLNGVKKMMSEDAGHLQVITQMKAARSALNSAMNKYIQQNFWEFVSGCEDEQDACKKFISELLEVS